LFFFIVLISISSLFPCDFFEITDENGVVTGWALVNRPHSHTEISCDLGFLNFGNEFSNNSNFNYRKAPLYKNLNLTLNHKFYNFLEIWIGIASIQYNSYLDLSHCSLTMQNSLIKLLRLGYIYDFNQSNRTWSSSFKANDGFDKVFFELFYDFEFNENVQLNTVLGMQSQVGDDYINPNNYDIRRYKKYNDFNGAYFINKITKKFNNLEYGIGIQFNYFRSTNIDNEPIDDTDGYLLSISPLVKISLNDSNTYITIDAYSTYENIRYGIPIFGKNTLAPIPTVNISFVKKWEDLFSF
ncbi:hypothetical protein ACFLYJ_03660, partial [Candidatus Cloacimonadota bacterium]